jgi:hypothetical protein
MINRKIIKASSITQANNASSINNKRKMARRAKTQSNKTMRQFLKKEMGQEI